MGAALDLARELGGEQGATLAPAKSAYVDGMGVGMLVAAGVALLGSVIAVLFLPSRARMGTDAPVEVGPDLEVVTA